jgi:hypothetical protein
MLGEAEALPQALVGLREQISPEPVPNRIVLGSDQAQDEAGTAAGRRGKPCGGSKGRHCFCLG